MDFKKISNELMFNLSEEDENYIKQKFLAFDENIIKIKEFNLDKFKEDLKEPEELKNGILRDDFESNDFDNCNIFENCFSFEEQYVKVNNDK